MKKLTFLILSIFVCSAAVGQKITVKRFENPIREALSKQEISIVHDELKAERRTDGGIYTVKVKDDMKSKDPIRLEYDGKFLSLEPRYIEWDVKAPRLFNREVVNASIELTLTAKEEEKDKTKKIKYENSFMSLSAELQPTKFRKVVTLDCDKFKIPEGAKALKISFVIESDMNLPADGLIDGRVEIAEDCWLEPAKAGIVNTTEYVTVAQRLYHDGDAWIYEKSIPLEVIKDRIYTDLDITFGNYAVLHTGISAMLINCAVFPDKERFVAIEKKIITVNPECIICSMDVNEATIVAGVPEAMSPNADLVRVGVFDNQYFLAVFVEDDDDDTYIYIGECTGEDLMGVDMTYIAHSDTYGYASLASYPIGLAVLSSTYAVMAGRVPNRDSDGYISAVYNRSATSANSYFNYEFSANDDVEDCEVVGWGLHKACVVYINGTESDYLQARPFSVSTTPSFGTNSSLNIAADFISACTFSEDKMYVSYVDKVDTRLMGVTAEVSPTTVTWASPYCIDEGAYYQSRVTPIDDTHVFLTYRKVDIGSDTVVRIITIDNDGALSEIGEYSVLQGDSTAYFDTAMIDINNFVSVYTSGGNEPRGKLGTIAWPAVTTSTNKVQKFLRILLGEL